MGKYDDNACSDVAQFSQNFVAINLLYPLFRFCIHELQNVVLDHSIELGGVGS